MLIGDEFCLEAPDAGVWGPFSIQPDLLSQVHFAPETFAHKPSRHTIVGQNSWKIEQACIWYLSERLRVRDQEVSPGTHREDRSCYNTARVAISKFGADCKLVSDVAKLAVNVLCRTSGFAEYIYGVGANDPMEQLFQWRLAPSMQTRLAIMEPFQPTPLQYMTTDYPIVIDFINWPSIRDQLIFKLGSYDLDQVVADIVANTVIEIPEMRVAINIHDTFFTRVFSNTAAIIRTKYGSTLRMTLFYHH